MAEVFYRINENHIDPVDRWSLRVEVNTHTREITIISGETYCFRGTAPVEGYDILEFARIARALRCRPGRLAELLCIGRSREIVGPSVELFMTWMQMRRFTLNQVVWMVHTIEPELRAQAELAQMIDSMLPVSQGPQEVLLRAQAELAQMIDGMLPVSQGPQEVLQLNEAAPTDDQCCSICLETNAETPGQGWSTAEGCDIHRFHTNCIRQWTSATCPMCRAPLQMN